MFYVSWLILTLHTRILVRASELYPYTTLRHGAILSERAVRECHAVQGREEIFEVSLQLALQQALVGLQGFNVF